MGGFDSKVDSLLEIYSKCLSLLKGLKGRANSRGHQDQPLQLRKCIRSDRSKVRQVYSSQLSLNGSHLQKGDATARSSLRKVIKRLTSALTRLLSLGRTQNSVIDYQSWRSLSSSSRVDAVKAINDLSRRLSSSTLKSSSSSSNKAKYAKGTRASSKLSSLMYKKPTSNKTSHHQTGPPDLPAGSISVPHLNWKRHIPVTTISSGSTKLGEINSHRIRCRQSACSAVDEFVVTPTYPLRPYCTGSKRKVLWGLFERK
ncbi:hypothetical protein CPLU01_04114 [Colletotrichum plurivorum]|uniref:Uncharacterized protein n=1 Tax=Colletotrichum plurivorum TaxID=2175906 RepID=A0A8H6KQJ3_9PEZI|nr:hypothetical protein CPLU01_04114 [Colletotrichum plurivorum]